jgi:hypothetical protein
VVLAVAAAVLLSSGGGGGGNGGGKVAGREEGGEVEERLIITGDTGRLDSLESCVCGCALGGAAAAHALSGDEGGELREEAFVEPSFGQTILLSLESLECCVTTVCVALCA